MGLRRIARPEPHEVIAFHDGEMADTHLRRNQLLPGNLHATGRTIELKAVIQAADRIAFEPAVREQGASMRAAIVQDRDLAALAPEQQQMVAEQRARNEAAIDQLVIPRRDIPAIPEKHASSPRGSAWARL